MGLDQYVGRSINAQAQRQIVIDCVDTLSRVSRI
jgi:hypothetical protein